MERERITIRKLDVARSQLETAIQLWFESRDVHSIHTLAAAAHEILDALGEPHGIHTAMFHPAYLTQKDITNVRRPQNFKKHADRKGECDPSAELPFDPFQAELTMQDAAHQYMSLTGELTHLMRAYLLFFASQHPELYEEEMANAPDVQACKYLARIEFLKAFNRGELLHGCGPCDI